MEDFIDFFRKNSIYLILNVFQEFLLVAIKNKEIYKKPYQPVYRFF